MRLLDAPHLRDDLARAPLVAIAAVFTVGIVLDAYLAPHVGFVLVLGTALLLAFLTARLGGHHRLATVYLLLAVTAFGAARAGIDALAGPDDIGIPFAASPSTDPSDGIQFATLLENVVKLRRGIDEKFPKELYTQSTFKGQPLGFFAAFAVGQVIKEGEAADVDVHRAGIAVRQGNRKGGVITGWTGEEQFWSAETGEIIDLLACLLSKVRVEIERQQDRHRTGRDPGSNSHGPVSPSSTSPAPTATATTWRCS